MKIAICLPIHRSPRAGFVISFAQLLIHTARLKVNSQPVELGLLTLSTSLLAYSRNELAEHAIEARVNALLWMDDDHTFPADALVRLLRHDREVVGINYVKRGESPQPTAEKDGQPAWTTKEKAEAGELEQVDSMGLGLCLMGVGALLQAGRPFFDGMLEDRHLFRNLKTAGVPVHVDHALSWECSHIGDYDYKFP